jgi:geranylgeranyl diphosphate synthase type II
VSAEGVSSELLSEYGELSRRALRTYLNVRGDRGAEYLPAALRDYPERGGRSLRSSLCIAAARAFGAPVEDALDSAVALEILHNAFLIHDDIEDASEERRGRPALHVVHGVPIAINVGDALSIVSLQPLLQNRRTLGLRLSLRILEEAERMARETVEGQAIELGWRRTNATKLDDDDYLRMVLKKTCWYTTIFPLRVGALIGTSDGVDLEHFVRFGFFVGAAFQIQDDLLNLIGDAKRYGKELGGDLWEGKRTLVVVHLLKHVDRQERRRLRAFLAQHRNRKRASDVEWVRRLMDRYGSIEYAQGVAHGLSGAALLEFDRCFSGLAESRDLAFIRELPTWVISRA